MVRMTIVLYSLNMVRNAWELWNFWKKIVSFVSIFLYGMELFRWLLGFCMIGICFKT